MKMRYTSQSEENTHTHTHTLSRAPQCMRMKIPLSEMLVKRNTLVLMTNSRSKIIQLLSFTTYYALLFNHCSHFLFLISYFLCACHRYSIWLEERKRSIYRSLFVSNQAHSYNNAYKSYTPHSHSHPCLLFFENTNANILCEISSSWIISWRREETATHTYSKSRREWEKNQT